MESLCLVIPCYNEETVLPVTAPLFLEKLRTLVESGRVSAESAILFVDDGSSDSTWPFICRLADANPEVMGISLSRNRGHQNALLAGLTEAADRYDLTVSLDCDGQDDIEAVDRMLEERAKGAEVVYGVRSERNTDTVLKRWTARTFYHLLSRMGADVVYDHADFRLLSARALRELLRFEEVNIYLRGMVPLVGFQSSRVEYARKERQAGSTHYPLRKMIDLALNGITGLTVRPLRLILMVGLILTLTGFPGVLVTVVLTAGGILSDPVWILLSACVMLGGMQLCALGLVGEYVGKTYLESKHRPRFIIAERTGMRSSEK